jgi:two-component system OmpR family response regulator
MMYQSNGKSILVVDDDPVFSEILQLSLINNGYECSTASSAKGALAEIQNKSDLDLVIVDFDLGADSDHGLTLCREIKDTTGKPVVMLTAESSTEITAACLYAGADQYVTKPYILEELLARIYSTLKNSSQTTTSSSSSSSAGGMAINSKNRTIRLDNNVIYLSAREFAVAEILFENFDNVVSRERIYSTVFGHELPPLSRAVDIIIGRLRKKLCTLSESAEIVSARSAGYILTVSLIPAESGVEGE